LAAGFNEVTNNYLKHAQIEDLAKKIKQCRSQGDTACIEDAIKKAQALSDANSNAMRACKTRECLDAHKREIDAAAPAYELIRGLEDSLGSNKVTALAFGNSQIPNSLDNRYYYDAIRSHPEWQNPYEKGFYALDAANRTALQKAIFGRELTPKENQAVLASLGGNPLENAMVNAGLGGLKDKGVLTEETVGLFAIALGGVTLKGKGGVGAAAGLGKAEQSLIKQAEKISTAKPPQVNAPRNLQEQLLWEQTKLNPESGKTLTNNGKALNDDPRFPASAGFQKMETRHQLRMRQV